MKTMREAFAALERIKGFLFNDCHTVEEYLAGADIPGSATQVCNEVLRERKRQVVVKGWSRLHDDEHHATGELAEAAAVYALSSTGIHMTAIVEEHWPFQSDGFKRKTPREDLIRAAALIVAEIERLDRAANKQAAYKAAEPEVGYVPNVSLADPCELITLESLATRIAQCEREINRIVYGATP